MKIKIKYVLIITGVILFIIAAFDSRLKVVNYTLESEKISGDITFVLISDLHGCEYGQRQSELLEEIEKAKPDAVLLCGDIFDDKYNTGGSYDLIDGLKGKYETFYVSGNHEWWGTDTLGIFSRIEDRGVKVLRGNVKSLEINGNKVSISGTDDPAVDEADKNHIGFYEQLAFVGAKASDDCFNILLSHRPELAEKYFEYDFDLVLSGHAHGGQVRIPFILNGLYSPGEGFFPKMAGGIYEFESGKMIVSRGLSRENTVLPRIFNRPELVVITVNEKIKDEQE
ncbi:MAG: metallophosphoesterase [Clostridia bacterium]|nr:metallophosphoesterase [Clostridia bacterium]